MTKQRPYDKKPASSARGKPSRPREDAKSKQAKALAPVQEARRTAKNAGKARLRKAADLLQLVKDRKAAAEALALEHGQLLSILESIDEAIIVSAPKTQDILFSNQKARSLFGPGLDKKGYALFQKLAKSPPVSREAPVSGKDMAEARVCEFQNPVNQRWYHCVDRELMWPGGKKVHYQMAVDITAAKQLAQERFLSQKMAIVGRLAGGIAHDFNNILTVIMGNLSLLEQSQGTPEYTLLLGEISEACLRARDLSNQLLTFSKGGAPVKEAASLDQLIRETVDFALSGSAVSPQYHIADNLRAVKIDRIQISQVIQNVILNSDEAMPAGGVIEITAENCHSALKPKGAMADADYVKVTITDHGEGISPEILDHIYEPYYTTKNKGRGLGLATAYSIMAQHKGHIAVNSRVTQGTTVELFLPATREQPQERTSSHTLPPSTGTKKGRILVMDDDRSIRALAKRFLDHLGFECVEAPDGAEAVRFYREALTSKMPFAAVIFDLTVPGGMGGREALRQLRAVDPEAKAIVSSGYSDDPVMSNFAREGFRGILRKPYDLSDIKRVLNEVLAPTP